MATKPTTAAAANPAAKADHKLDKLPPGGSFHLHTAADGTVTIQRDEDAAVWDADAETFVVPDPEPQRYVVTVEVGAIDDPSARSLVDQALRAFGVSDFAITGMAELADTVRADVERQVRDDLTPVVLADLERTQRPEIKRRVAAAVAEAIRAALAEDV